MCSAVRSRSAKAIIIREIRNRKGEQDVQSALQTTQILETTPMASRNLDGECFYGRVGR